MVLRHILLMTLLAAGAARALEKGCAKGCARSASVAEKGLIAGEKGGYSAYEHAYPNITPGISRAATKYVIMNERNQVQEIYGSGPDYSSSNHLSYESSDSLFTGGMRLLFKVQRSNLFTDRDSMIMDSVYNSSLILANYLGSRNPDYFKSWTKDQKSNTEYFGFLKFYILLHAKDKTHEAIQELIKEFKSENISPTDKKSINKFLQEKRKLYFPYHNHLIEGFLSSIPN